MEGKSVSVVPIDINQEMKSSYLEYAMSVIVSRAIPDLRDGLKPVHRRILFAMNEIGCDHNKPYKKSARIIGDVMGKYHPHGDAAIYDALVRMAQDFAMGTVLIEGQGNFGSIDNDPAAASRYTEARLAKISHTFLEDLSNNTVPFRLNYDGNESEPEVLPAAFPNILVNGGTGIAVGMATNIPTHNLTEILDACLAYIENPNITAQELVQIVPAPDFPTGGIVLSKIAAQKAIMTGRGSVPVRGKVEFEKTAKDKDRIVITEIPYQVIKSKMIEKIIDLHKNKTIVGISSIRDESNKKGIRIVIDVNDKESSKEVILNQLYQFTPLQSSVSYNMTVLDVQKPVVMGIRDIISKFIDFRNQVIRNRLMHLVLEARNRAHLMIGLHVAVDSIDEVVSIIRHASDVSDAKSKLLAKRWKATENVIKVIELISDDSNKIHNGEFSFTDQQVKAILEMRLSKLTGLERDKIAEELFGLANEIERLLDILSSKENIMNVVKTELEQIKQNFPQERRTEVLNEDIGGNFNELDFIEQEDVLVVRTKGGFIKRMPIDIYTKQHRGGSGKYGIDTEEDDYVEDVFVSNTHSNLLFFTTRGKVYTLGTHKIPEFKTTNAKGRAIVNLFNFEKDEIVTNCISVQDYHSQDSSLLFATKKGNVRRSMIDDFEKINQNGKIAISLDEDDALVDVKFAHNESNILLSTKNGLATRFKLNDLRFIKSRSSDGVRGMSLAKDDYVVSVATLNDNKMPIEIRDIFLAIPFEDRNKLKQNPDDMALRMNLFHLFSEACKAKELINPLSEQELTEYCLKEELIFCVTSNGFGKLTSAYDYRITNRGGKGITSVNASNKNGYVVSSFVANKQDELIIMSKNGKVIRISLEKVPVIGRNTKGVTLLNLEDEDKVASVVKLL